MFMVTKFYFDSRNYRATEFCFQSLNSGATNTTSTTSPQLSTLAPQKHIEKSSKASLNYMVTIKDKGAPLNIILRPK